MESSVYKRQYDGLPEPTRPAPECCEACGDRPSGRYKNLCLDHCHVTDTFRAWLCHRCNRALGLVKDNPKILNALINILEEHKRSVNIKGDVPIS